MSDSDVIDAASRRLALALDALGAAVERRNEADQGHDAVAAQLRAFDTDRAMLASNLDATTARVKQLETANREVARRLEVAIDTIRTVLEANDR
jgi:septal ring factor EnvC (AmiA/AmiB activator)